MKILLNLLIITTIGLCLACTKDDSSAIHSSKNMKCVVGCLPEGFDFKMTINNGDTLEGTFVDQVWGYEFTGVHGDQLTIIAKAKVKKASLFVTLYKNDTIIHEQHITNSDNFPSITLRDTVN
jgi:hypothetical protein